MTIGRDPNLYLPLRLLILSAFVAAWAVSAQGVTSIEVQIGFSGHVVPERYAPFRMRVRDYAGTGASHVVVSQRLGNEWRDTSTVRHELGLAVSSDGSFAAVLPIYEPLNPMAVALIDETGEVLAEVSLDLRATRHLDPFPLVYGSLPYTVAEEGPSVIAAELPSSWWAFDAVRALWISAPPPQEAWPAIAQWVLAGGSLILTSGPDYFRFDSPILRVLLPLSSPTITDRSDGFLSLDGTLKPGASASVLRGEAPLLVHWPYGAGHVAVLTVRPADLDPSALDEILATIPESNRLSMTAVSETLLGEMSVVRPTHLTALLLVALSSLGFGTVVVVGRRRRLAGVVTASCLFAALAVWFGLYTNRANEIPFLYRMNTSLHVETSFGIQVDAVSFYCTDPAQREHLLASEALPIQAPPAALDPHPIYLFMPQPTATPWAYEHTAAPGRIVTSVAEIGLKTFYAFSTSASPLRLTVDGAERRAVLTCQAEQRLVDCWLIVDGRGTRVSPLSAGTFAFPLSAEETLGSLSAQADGPASLVLQHLAELFPFQQGVWFVGLGELEDARSPLVGQKVRHLDVYVVRGEIS